MFADQSAKHCPIPHFHFSNNWLDDHERQLVTLGEKSDATKKYSNGSTSAGLARDDIAGSVDAIFSGSRLTLEQVGGSLRDGFDSRCWSGERPLLGIDSYPIGDYCAGSDLAALLNYLAADTPLLLTELESIFGSGGNFLIKDNPLSIYPKWAVGSDGTWNLVLIGGTTTLEQLALQSLSLTFVPVYYNGYYTCNLWNLAAEAILNTMSINGFDMDKPTLIAGYSYGGAVTALVGERLYTGNPERDVRLVTYGMPKPGSAVLVNRLRPLLQVHWEVEGDPVPLVPPRFASLAPFLPLLPGFVVSNWNRFDFLPNRVRLLLAGGAVAVGGEVWEIEALATLVQYALVPISLPLFPLHDLEAYGVLLTALCTS